MMTAIHPVAALLACVGLTDLVDVHVMGLPINPVLGVPGFPDCLRAHPDLSLSEEEAADDLVCECCG